MTTFVSWFTQTKNIVMITKERSTKIVNYMTPGRGSCDGAWAYKSNSKNPLFYIFENLLLPGIDQKIKHIVMMTKEGSTKIVNLITPREGIFGARAWPYKSYSENALPIFLKNLLLYSQA